MAQSIKIERTDDVMTSGFNPWDGRLRRTEAVKGNKRFSCLMLLKVRALTCYYYKKKCTLEDKKDDFKLLNNFI